MSNNVVFFGTPKIAANCLQALLDTKVNVVGVVTKVDGKVGRKQTIQFSEVKQLALQNNLKIFQPNKLVDIESELCSLNADLFVVCAYGKIIPESIFNIPKYHTVNVHTSLLPKWRGGAPIHYAILNGDQKTGVSLMYVAKELDAGNVIKQFEIPINEDETYISLYDKLSNLSYKVIKENIHDLFNQNVKSISQDNSKVTYARVISREDERINWNKSAKEIDAKVRGLYDEPIAYSMYNGLNIKIAHCSITNLIAKGTPGQINEISKKGIFVNTNDYQICIDTLQIPGKKMITVNEMLNGNHVFTIDGKFI